MKRNLSKSWSKFNSCSTKNLSNDWCAVSEEVIKSRWEKAGCNLESVSSSKKSQEYIEADSKSRVYAYDLPSSEVHNSRINSSRRGPSF